MKTGERGNPVVGWWQMLQAPPPMKLMWPCMRVVPQLVPSELETYVPELKSPWQAIHPVPDPSFHVGYACARGAHTAQATRALITATVVVSE